MENDGKKLEIRNLKYEMNTKAGEELRSKFHISYFELRNLLFSSRTFKLVNGVLEKNIESCE
jgi:hypothetical protein